MRHLRTLAAIVMAVALLLPSQVVHANPADYTWQQSGLNTEYIAALAGARDGSVLIATGYEIQARSVDGGVTWEANPLPNAGDDFYSIVSDTTGSLFAAYNGNDNLIYTTADAGTTWVAQASTGLPVNTSGQLRASADMSLLVMWTSTSVLTSTDYGATWVTQPGSVTTDLYDKLQVSGDGQTIIGYMSNGSSARVRTSTDGGVTWNNQAGASVIGSVNWRETSLLSDNGSLMAASTSATGRPVFVSSNYGVTWAAVPALTLSAGNTRQLLHVTPDASRVIAQTKNGTYHVSTDQGATFTPSTVEPITSLYGTGNLVSNASGSVMYSVANYGDVFRSVDYGQSWQQVHLNQARAWTQIASSNDGTKLVIGDYDRSLWTSSDSGQTWDVAVANGLYDWYGTAISGDGQHMGAVEYNGLIHTSSDGGATWTDHPSVGSRPWNSIAISDDGQTIAATARNGGGFHISYDGGASWQQRVIPLEVNLEPVAMTPDGQTILLGDYGSRNLVVSQDSGATWDVKYTGVVERFLSVAVSADGLTMAAIDNRTNGGIHVSYDGGDTWEIRLMDQGINWSSVAMSDDASVMLAGTFGNYSYISTDSGVTWTQLTDQFGDYGWWTSMAISGDASRLFMTSYNDPIFIGVLGATTEEPVVDNDGDTIVDNENLDSGGSNLADTGASIHILALLAFSSVLIGILTIRRVIFARR